MRMMKKPFTLVSTLMGCVFMIHLIMSYSKDGGLDVKVSSKLLIHHPIVHELKLVEEEKIHMPPLRKLTTLIEDKISQIRNLFIPDMKSAFGPTIDANDTSHYYFPGEIWKDTERNPIQAHGGGILYDERSKIYYWYGEYRVNTTGVGCYSSKDLWTWKNEGIVLSAEETNESNVVLERPKVIYNSRTEKYVMWMHIDNGHYSKAMVGVAISDKPTGPFDYLYSKSPHGFDSRDMAIFKDDDNIAYLIYSSEKNSVLHIGPLTEDYLDVKPVMKRILVGLRREAPAMFKHQNIYYMITSACTGWAPNEALVHTAESIMGPWDKLGNPCVGGDKTTFFSQSTYVVPLQGVPGSFIFMADRWNRSNLSDSRYVWLPLIVDRSRVSIYWHSKWRLPSGGDKKTDF